MADSETGESEVKKENIEPAEAKTETVNKEDEAKPEPEKKKSDKVEVRLQATGDAPIMKQKNYNVDKDKPISWILAFIRRYLKFQSHESLYLYVNQVRNICKQKNIFKIILQSIKNQNNGLFSQFSLPVH